MPGENGIHAAMSSCSEGNDSTALNSFWAQQADPSVSSFFWTRFWLLKVTMKVEVTFLHGNANTNQGIDKVYEIHIQRITLRSFACRLH